LPKKIARDAIAFPAPTALLYIHLKSEEIGVFALMHRNTIKTVRLLHLVKINKWLVTNKGVGRGGVPPWIFIHGTDKVETCLMMLFFGLVFSVDPPEIFLPTP